MRSGNQREPCSQQHDAGTPFAPRSLHGMGDADGGIDRGKEAQRGRDFGIRAGTCRHHGRRDAKERQRDEAAAIAEEPACDPPQCATQQQRRHGEGKAQQQADVAQFVPHLPGAGIAALAHDQALHRERQSGHAIGEHAIVNVAATCEVAGDGRRPLPHLPAATRVLIITLGERRPGDLPQALTEQQKQQQSGDLLRAVEAEAAEMVAGALLCAGGLVLRKGHHGGGSGICGHEDASCSVYRTRG
jgi:hypothetical protein